VNAHQLLGRLDDLGIALTVAGDRLRYRATQPPPPELLAEVKQHRDALIELLGRRAALTWPLPRPAGSDRRGPLSLAQRKVWATNLFLADGRYNLAGALRLIGPLDQVAFAAAVADVHRRHPSLRTVFTVDDGRPVQHVLPAEPPSIVPRDLSDDPSPLDACRRECQAVVAGLLALEPTPPVRPLLYRLAADDYVFAVVMHHVLADGVSIRVLLDDLGRCYNARLDGAPVEPAAGDVDMVDYARFEEELSQCADLASARRYWHDVLRAAPLGRLPLPPRSTQSTVDNPSSALALDVDAATTAGVRRVAAATRSTPFLVVSAAISSMLSRFTGRDDLVVGMPVSRRNRPGLDRLVGLLLDLVPVRLQIGGQLTFVELVQRTRTAVLGAVSNSSIAAELALDDHPSKPASRGMPLFTVVLTDNGTRIDPPTFRGLDVSSPELAQVGSKFDLNVLIRDDAQTLHLDVEFDPQILDEGDVAAMMDLAVRILAEAVADPAKRVLDLAPPPTAQPLAAHHTAPQTTAVIAVDDSLFHDSLFGRLARMAADRGDHGAITHADTTLSYRALHERVDRVARGLRRLGHGPGDIVAIELARGIDLVVAMIGVMGSGAACLVLDDSWPPARTEQVRRDASAVRIIASDSDVDEGRISVDQLAGLGATAEPVPAVPAAAIAYLIYTSGSTGRPKGVLVAHRAVLSLLDGTSGRFGFGPADVWTLLHSCSFDVAIWEIFGCLLSGGRLVVVPQSSIRDPVALAELVRCEQVTVLNLTPSALSASLSTLAGSPERIRYLIFAGEALDPRLVQRWYQLAGDGPQLVNMYGITETTVHASWHWLRPGRPLVASASWRGDPTVESEVGTALPGTSLHLVYDNGRPVDDRCVGEIYVAGAGVAVGYFGQPRDTALRFVPDPFAPTPGARMYRSGDIGRRNPDGIAYLGRRDSQFQVNGFRVELGEVEAALVAQLGVAAAAAAAATDDSGTSIVAVVVADEPAVPIEDVVRGVRAILPRYMVPSTVRLVAELPLTTNGKLDRAAVLAAARADRPAWTESARTPSGVEGVLVQLFAEVLHDPTVGTDTDFFDRGGDSMRAVRLVSLASQRGLALGVPDVYAAPNPEDLARRARTGTPTAPRPPFSLLPGAAAGSFPDTVEDAYPVTALQFGMMYLRELAPDSGAYHIVLSYRIRGPVDEPAFRAAAQAVTDRHPVLRTSFDLSHPSGPMQLVHSYVDVPIEFVDLRHLDPAVQADRVAHLVERERAIAFDLTRPGLFRLVVVTRSDDDYQLIFSHHHAILDGWSVSVFFDDLHAQYWHFRAGAGALALPPLRSVVAEYVALEQAAQTDRADRDFWSVRTAPGLGLLVPDRSGQPVMRQIRVDMRDGLMAELRACAGELGVTVKALLVAAHVRVLVWLAGRDEVVTGSIVNCRPETPDTDQALGLFLNEYPVRIELTDQTWAELARQTHADEQAMAPHRWYPHALIQKQHGTAPIFDNYVNFTEFHTSRRLIASTGVEILDVTEVESTHYALGVNYTVDVRTGQLRLIIEYDESVLARPVVELTAEAHEQALSALVAQPSASCRRASLPGTAELARRLLAGARPAPTQHPLWTQGQSASELEHGIQEVWSEVLGPVQVDGQTSFFDAGGDSLRAMRVVSRLRALYGELSMETFLQAPTVSGLAQALNTGQPRQYPVTAAQRQLWELTRQLPGLALFGMPGALRAKGPLDIDRLRRTFAILLDRHAALRTRFVDTEAGPVQIVEPHADLDLETVDLRAEADPLAACDDRLAHALLDPIDLTRAPLVQAGLYRIGDADHVMYLNIHHAICDGWSMAVLLEEAKQVYRALSTSAPAHLPVTAGSSAEVAQADREWLGSAPAAAQRQYWIDRLAPPWPPLSGPGNRFGSPKPTTLLDRLRSANCRRRLPSAVAASIRVAARQSGLTEFMVLLAAYAATLRSWSGQSDIRVATMTANRLPHDRELVVGLLANTVVLRLQVDADSDPAELGAQVRQVCLDAYERQRLPFEEVLAGLKQTYPAPDRAGHVFDAMLLLQEETIELTPQDGLRWSPYRPRRGSLAPPVTPTTCDLVLAATPAGGEMLLDLQYVPAAIEPATAQALLDHIAATIQRTVAALMASP
jgi:amino acid adenylation domain-containing protein